MSKSVVSFWICITVRMCMGLDKISESLSDYIKSYLSNDDKLRYNALCATIDPCHCIVKESQNIIQHTFDEFYGYFMDNIDDLIKQDSLLEFDNQILFEVITYHIDNYQRYRYLPVLSLYFDNIIDIQDISPFNVLQFPDQLRVLKQSYTNNKCNTLTKYSGLNNSIYVQFGQQYYTIYSQLLSKISHLLGNNFLKSKSIQLFKYCYSFESLLLELHYQRMHPYLVLFKLDIKRLIIQFWHQLSKEVQHVTPPNYLRESLNELKKIRKQIRKKYPPKFHYNKRDPITITELIDFVLNLKELHHLDNMGQQLQYSMLATVRYSIDDLDATEMQYLASENLTKVSSYCNYYELLIAKVPEYSKIHKMCTMFWNKFFSFPPINKLLIID